jgi:hypothetical protein
LMLVGFILYPAVPWYEIIALPIGFTFIIKYIINKYEN